MTTTRTDADMQYQVIASLTEFADDFDVASIVADLITRFGLVDIDSIPSDDYWAIVQRHDISQQSK